MTVTRAKSPHFIGLSPSPCTWRGPEVPPGLFTTVTVCVLCEGFRGADAVVYVFDTRLSIRHCLPQILSKQSLALKRAIPLFFSPDPHVFPPIDDIPSHESALTRDPSSSDILPFVS